MTRSIVSSLYPTASPGILSALLLLSAEAPAQPARVSPDPQAAIEALGRQLLAEGQWERAHEVYRDWQPRSGCGSCRSFMQADRRWALLHCAWRLGRWPELVDSAWLAWRNGDTIGGLVLIRVHAEAGRLDALALAHVDAMASLAQREQDNPNLRLRNSESRYFTWEEQRRAFSRAIALAREPNLDRLAAELPLRGRHSPSRPATVEAEVAAWRLVQAGDDAVPHLAAAATKGHPSHRAALLLAQIDTPAARRALEKLTADQYWGLEIASRLQDRKKRTPLFEPFAAALPQPDFSTLAGCTGHSACRRLGL